MPLKTTPNTTTQNIKPSSLSAQPLPSVAWQLTTFAELSGYQIYNIIQAREQVFVKDQQCSYIDADGVDFAAIHLAAYSVECNGADSNDSGNCHMQLEKQTGANVKVAQLAAPQLLAYCRIIPPTATNDGYPHIGRVLVLADYRGAGLARQLMLRALNYCHSHFAKQPIHLSAQTYLIEFYQSLGFVCVGEVYSADGIEHIHMVLAALLPPSI